MNGKVSSDYITWTCKAIGKQHHLCIDSEPQIYLDEQLFKLSHIFVRAKCLKYYHTHIEYNTKLTNKLRATVPPKNYVSMKLQSQIYFVGNVTTV